MDFGGLKNYGLMNSLKRNGGTVSLLRTVVFVMAVLSLAAFWQSEQVTNSLSSLYSTGESSFSAPYIHHPEEASLRLQFSKPCKESCTLPKWMQSYLQWHSKKLQQIQQQPQNQQPWLKQKLLVIRCLSEDRCGGAADRLKSLPLYLAVAAKTKRLLFLRWTRPFRLEEFLVPSDALNWTVPDTLALLLDSNVTSKVVFGAKALNQIVRAAHNPNHWLVEGAAQMAGGDLFRRIATELSQDEPFVDPPDFFHEMFLVLFRPAPNLYKLVEHQMRLLDLWPNEFVTAHIRAKYPGEPYRETWNQTLLQRTVTNAVDCAASLAPTVPMPIYVASDTLLSLQAAQAYGKHFTPYRVVSHLDVPPEDLQSQDVQLLPHQDPPHLNFAKEEDPSAFFSIFADLFIMSQSRCVAFGAGGFGRFGSLVSFNASCRVAHSTRGKLNNCTARDGANR